MALQEAEEKNSDLDPQPMSDALLKHLRGDEVAVINDSICNKNGVPCMYAQKKEDESETCALKNALDEFIYSSLKSGLILQMKIADCDHYIPSGKSDLQALAKQMLPIDATHA